MNDTETANYLYLEILKAVEDDDDEVAHSREDKLRRHALGCASLGAENWRAIVALAISTEELDFCRWCA